MHYICMKTTATVAIDEYGTVRVFGSMAAAIRHYSPNYKVKKKDKFGNVSFYDSAEDADNNQHGVKISTHVIER